jgi:hypothetical protein
LVLIRDGLLSGTQVNDAEASAAYPDLVVDVQAILVGASVMDDPQHAPQQPYIGRVVTTPVRSTDYATHNAIT